MEYAPHILWVKSSPSSYRDEYGRTVVTSDGEWRKVSACRCDDNQQTEIRTPSGEWYRPKYKIVAPRDKEIEPGMTVRATNSDGTVRGSGEAKAVTRTNFLDYEVIWI